MTLHTSVELRQVLAEAEDIANQVSQPLTSAHLLLGLFTVENRAKILLNEKGIDEDVLLEHVHSVASDPDGTVREVRRKTAELAESVNAEAVDCLHLLIALLGLRDTMAYELLRLAGLPLTQFRNTALSYVTNALPRRLTIKKKAQAQVSAGPAAAAASAPPASVAEEVAEECPLDDRPEVGPVRPRAGRVHAALATGPLGAFDLDPAVTPMLHKLGRNLTALAAQGRLDPLIGRDRELEEVIDTLLKRRSNNPLLVGEPGVGKTAIVEGLAVRIVKNAPDARALADRRIIELDVAGLLAGTQLRGSFSEKLQQIRDEVRAAEGRIVVFFDEMHTLIGAGSTGDGSQDAANELKAALARGEFPCIGATTYDEYRRFVEGDAALARRFQLIQVGEPTPEATLEILRGVATEYSEHHGVRYADEAFEAAVHLASRYITDRCMPDKALSLLDLAGSRARRSGRNAVDRQAIARVVSSVANIPVERLLMTDAERLLNMEQILGLQIIGHTSVIRSIARVIRRNYAGFSHRRPIGSFLFLGPTGVGKTECGKALAQFLFGAREALVRLDMTEYSEPHTVARLIGAPPGYIGHNEGGQLTEAVRRKPYAIVLFDEVEKAHAHVQQILLQLLDDGRLTDGRGRTVDFTNAVVILTSNRGAEALGRPNAARLGFGSDNVSSVDVARDVLQRARGSFPPELWGRMDEQLFFRQLVPEELVAIAGLLLRETAQRLEQERRIRLQVGSEVARFLVAEGCLDLSLGARPLRAAVRRYVEEPLSEAILAGRFKAGAVVAVQPGPGGLGFETVSA